MIRSKTSAILQEIVFKHHPAFKNNSASRLLFETLHEVVNVERLVEQTMAHVGGYNFVDGHGYDFDDGEALGCPNSECKTASIWPNPIPKGNRNSYKLEVSNVCRTGPQGGEKCGALRIVLYNSVNHTLHYYFIPKLYWQNMITIHPTSGIGKIVATWNSVTNTCNKLDPFEVDSFESLAMTSPNAGVVQIKEFA